MTRILARGASRCMAAAGMSFACTSFDAKIPPFLPDIRSFKVYDRFRDNSILIESEYLLIPY